MGALATLPKLLPIVLAFGSGVLFARWRVIAAESSKAFSDFAFLLAIPCLLFVDLYQSNLSVLFDWQAIGGYILSAAITILLVGLATYLFSSRQPQTIALRIMGGVQVNTAYFAIPVFVMLFATAAPVFPVLLFQVCALSPVIILIMELGRAGVNGGAGSRRHPVFKLGQALWSSLTTPVVLACYAGIALNLLSLRVPRAILDGLSFVGASAAPVALFALGLHLGRTGLSLRGTRIGEILLIACKCLFFPLLTWVICADLFGIHGSWLGYLILIAAMPAPQNLFIFAQSYEVDIDLSASHVVKSSLTSLVLLPFWIELIQRV